MSLSYDFDINYLIPRERARARLVGSGRLAKGSWVALFRDNRTVLALRRAPQGLQNYLMASGFGTVRFSTGAPDGTFLAEDADARLDLAERLQANSGRFALPRAGDYPEAGDVFRLGEFLAGLETARPMAPEEAEVLRIRRQRLVAIAERPRMAQSLH